MQKKRGREGGKGWLWSGVALLLGSLAVLRILSLLGGLAETMLERDESLRRQLNEQNRLLAESLNRMTELVEKLSQEFRSFESTQNIVPLRELLQQVVNRESDLVRLLEHLPVVLKPIDYTAVLPATNSIKMQPPVRGLRSFNLSVFAPSEDLLSDSLRTGVVPGDLWRVTAQILTASNATHKRVVDIGGTFGQFGMIAASLGRRVIAFESSNRLAEKYAQSALLNGWQSMIDIHRVAVGSESSGTALDRRIATEHHQEELLVQIGKLDDYVPSTCEVEILRVTGRSWDVEVFRGAKRVLVNTDIVILEATREELSRMDASSLTTLLSFLESMNFGVYRRWADLNSKVVDFKGLASFIAEESLGRTGDAFNSVTTLYCLKQRVEHLMVSSKSK